MEQAEQNCDVIDESDSKGIEINLLRDKIDYTIHIIDTHFQTFNWLDVKMQALLAIAAASLAAATFAIKDLDGLTIFQNITIIIACILLIAGMLISLLHLIPILDSGVGNVDNPRVVIGIVKYDNKNHYHQRMAELNEQDMFRYNCFQIYGLAKICKTGKERLRTSILLVGTGLVLIAVTLFIWGIKSYDKNDTQLNTQPPRAAIEQKIDPKIKR